MEVNNSDAFSGELREDKNIELSCGSFEELHKLIISHIRDTKQLVVYNINSVTPSPTLTTIAEFAKLSYKELDKHQFQLPSGWKLLTAARNRDTFNGYFGAVFLHAKHFQVVIAHRGTKFSNLGALRADLSGVVGNVNVPQMDSACTFAVKVNEILHSIEMEKRNEVHFKLYLTGHSLGGWLAQITNFATEYLAIEKSLFVKASSLQKGLRHAHTATFESPGCKLMLSALKRKFGRRYEHKHCSVKALDITSYFLYPNIINSIREHVGQPYSIQTKNYSELTSWDTMPGLYTFKAHKMIKVIEALRQETPNIVAVLDWPITSVSHYFAKWCGSWQRHVPIPIKSSYQFMAKPFKYIVNLFRPSKNCELMEFFYDPNIRVGHCESLRTHYKTEPINENRRNLNIFTESEIKFLELYMILKKFPMHCKHDTLFAVIKSKKDRELVRWSLEDFKIENCYIQCDRVKMHLFIPYVQQLLYKHSEILCAIKHQLSGYSIRKELYRTEHLRLIGEIARYDPFFTETSGQMEYSVLQVVTEDVDMHITMMKIYKSVMCNVKDSSTCFIMKLKQLLHVETFASLEDLVDLPEMSNHVFIIECQLNRDSHSEACTLFQSITKVAHEMPSIKFIFVTRSSDKLTQLIEDEYKKNLGPAFRKTESRLKWEDLKPDKQTELLKSAVTDFNGQRTCLYDYLAISNDEWSQIIDSATVNLLIKGEDVKVSEERQQLHDLPSAFADIYEEIPEQSFLNALLQCPEESLFMVICSSNIVSKNDLMERLDIPSDLSEKLANKIILLSHLEKETNIERWKNLCHDNPNKTVFWVEVTTDHVFCQQIYDPQFYFKRHLHLFDLKCHMKQILKSNKTSDVFIISNVQEKQELMNLLNITESEFKEILFIALTEAEAERLYNQLVEQNKTYRSIHWLKITHEGCLIWFRSNGSLNLLREYKRRKLKNTTYLDEEMFWGNEFNYKDRVVIIAGEPGMGKSTTLTNISERVNGWVIHRELKNCQHAIEKLPVESIIFKHVIDFFVTTDSRSNVTSFCKSLLEMGLRNKTKEPTHLMFDGFDEIEKHARDKFLQLLCFLKAETNCNIWITTRSHLKEHLEDTLSVFAISFQDVNGDLQKEFLHRFWTVRHAIQLSTQSADINGLLSQHAADLLDQAKKIFGRETSSFMGVPLQLRMLAEAYPPKVTKFIIGTTPDELWIFQNETDLFQKFIQKKFDVYFNEKIGFGKHVAEAPKQWFIEHLLAKHRILAFQTLFPADAEKYLRMKVRNCISNDINLNRLGWIQSDPRDAHISFIHRSSAEYFAADLILHWLKKPAGRHQSYPNVEEFILSQILLKPEHKVIRLFLNGMLAKSTEENDECRYYKDRIAKCLEAKQELCYNVDRRTAIYVAVEENLDHILKFLFSCFKNTMQNLAALLSSRDKHKKTALYVAAEKVLACKGQDQKILPFTESKYRGTLTQFLDIVHGFPNSARKTLMLATCFRTAGDEDNPVFKNLLEIAESYSHMQDIVKEIRAMWKLIAPFLKSISDGKINDTERFLNSAGTGENGQIFRNYLIAATNKQNKTALYLAAKKGNSDIVNLLIHEGADVNLSYDSITPLHAAVENGYLAVVVQLLENNASVDAANKAQRTPLDCAVTKGYKDIVKVLLDYGACPKIAVEGDNPFCCLPECFEMNAKPLPNDLPYSLFCKQIPAVSKTDMSDIDVCFQLVIEKAKASFGPQDLRTLTSLGTFAKEWCRNGNYERSLSIYQHVLDTMSGILSPNDSIVLQTNISIAQMLSKQDRYVEALPFYENVHKLRAQCLGPNHKDTLLAHNSIAKLLSYMGKYEDALSIYRYVSENIPYNQTNYHDILITNHNTAQLLAHMENYAESLKLFKENDEKFVKSFSGNHAFTLITKLNIAQVLSNSSKYSEALQYYDICINCTKKVGNGSDGKTFQMTAEHDKRIVRSNMCVLRKLTGSYFHGRFHKV